VKIKQLMLIYTGKGFEYYNSENIEKLSERGKLK
jgi:hypothetical protein